MDETRDIDELAGDEAESLFARLEVALPSTDEQRNRLEKIQTI